MSKLYRDRAASLDQRWSLYSTTLAYPRTPSLVVIRMVVRIKHRSIYYLNFVTAIIVLDDSSAQRTRNI
jgi:hypothetical protein